jgi:anti-sigma-K factor RskA
VEEIRSYIESGILELYAAGDLNAAEKLQVEEMLVRHPILKKELDEIEKSLEQYARAYSIEPSEGIRQKVLATMTSANKPTAAPAEVVSLPAQRDSFFRYAFAASVALLIMSIAGLITLYSRLQDSRQQIAILSSSNQQFSNRVNYMEKQLSDKEVALGVLRNPEFKLIKLAGTKQAPKASMMVAFNPKKKEVMIDMSSMKMPENDPKHQYQLWAMVDGKPVDLGVFDMKPEDDGMVRMKEVENAQAFAVTLERRGGNDLPTMDQMMVIGSF